MSWVRYVLSTIISKYWGCPLWILALSMRPKELFTINFSAWDPFSTRAPMNIKLRDPSHKPKLSLILLRAWVGRKNDNGHLISFYIFGQQPFQLTNTASQHATVISQQKLDGLLGKEVVSTKFSKSLRFWNYCDIYILDIFFDKYCSGTLKAFIWHQLHLSVINLRNMSKMYR